MLSIFSTRGPAVYQLWYTLPESGTPCPRTGTPWPKIGTHLTVRFEKSKVKICLKIQAASIPKESEKIMLIFQPIKKLLRKMCCITLKGVPILGQGVPITVHSVPVSG